MADAPAEYADITADDFIEVEWVQGSGYGWALVEKPPKAAWPDARAGYAVLLINEDPGEPLAVLRTFASPPSRKFTDGITLAITNGRGEALQRLAAAITRSVDDGGQPPSGFGAHDITHNPAKGA